MNDKNMQKDSFFNPVFIINNKQCNVNMLHIVIFTQKTVIFILRIVIFYLVFLTNLANKTATPEYQAGPQIYPLCKRAYIHRKSHQSM